MCFGSADYPCACSQDDDPPAHIFQCPDCGKVDLLCECVDGPAFVLVPNPYREYGDAPTSKELR